MSSPAAFSNGLSRQTYLESFSLTPDGRTLVTVTKPIIRKMVSQRPQLKLWEVATGKERLRLEVDGYKPTISRDGRTLAALDGNQIRLLSLPEGRELGRLKGHLGHVACLRFASGGNQLISGSHDTTALVWNLAPLQRPKPVTKTVKNLPPLWGALTGKDAAKAYQAMTALMADPDQTVPFVAQRLKPAVGPDSQRVRKLVADLDSNQFAVRQQAEQSLAKLGELAIPALKERLAGKIALETRQRIKRLIEKLSAYHPLSAETLRTLRVLEVLERIGSDEATSVLRTLAKGSPGSRITRAAQAGLTRLGK